MLSVADQALQRLLARAENAAAKGDSSRKVRLPFSSSQFGAYLNLETRADKDACHGELRLAEEKGAVLIVWNRRAGAFNQIDALELKDGGALARHLGIVPRWQAVDWATTSFADYRAQFPVLKQVIDHWTAGKRPKSTAPEDAADWVLAARTIVYCRQSGFVDVPIRRVSTQFLFDSKKLERLLPLIDALLVDDLQLGTREAEDILNEIGLIKFPPTLLVAGATLVNLLDAEDQLSIRRPYLGLAPETIGTVQYHSTVSPVLLTIENLTTFHELARSPAMPSNIVLLYTGGMPSPSFKRAYFCFLDGLPECGQVFHWGDIDAGGFRIADHLARCCEQRGRKLHLHAMVPPATAEETPGRRPLGDAERSAINKICEAHHWFAERSAMETCMTAIEQEGLAIMWPNTVR